MRFVFKYQSVDAQGRYLWAEKSFKTQKDLFNYLVNEKEEIFYQKKCLQKRAEGCISMTLPTVTTEGLSTKAKPLYNNDKEKGLLQRTILTNTYWWLDHHSDVHIGRGDDPEGRAIFTESIKGREAKVFPMDQHKWDLDGKIGRTLKLYEAPVSWRALGVGKTGMTEGLFADAEISRERNEKRYKDYLNDEIDQHSVGMWVQDTELAINDEDYPKEYAVFQKYIAKIGNRKAAEDQGYYFPVSKAKLAEYSAVIAGSNELTPVMGVGSDSGEYTKMLPSGEGHNNHMMEAINKLLIKTQRV